jgi:hypothetical protein
MLYFVTGEWDADWRAKLKDEAARYMKEIVHPCLESLAKMNSSKKIVGGVDGHRAMFTVEAASRGEVFKMLATLPHWGQLKWDVKPLESFHTIISENQTNTEAELVTAAQLA